MTDKMTAEQQADASFYFRHEFWQLSKIDDGRAMLFFTEEMYERVRQDLTAPRVPDGWSDTLEKVRELIAGAPIDSLGVGHDEHCGHWPIRDEVVDSLTKLLTAAPAPADNMETQLAAKDWVIGNLELKCKELEGELAAAEARVREHQVNALLEAADEIACKNTGRDSMAVSIELYLRDKAARLRGGSDE